jgi:multiple sugar transport system substrate-binding protein
MIDLSYSVPSNSDEEGFVSRNTKFDARLALGEHGPGVFDAALGRRDFLVGSGKVLAAGATGGALMAATKKAWAAAEAASQGGDPVATRAVNAAKQYAGITLTTDRETGPNGLDDKVFAAPLWKKLTGINIKVIEAPFAQLYTKAIAEHVAGSGAIDVVEAVPSWIPDFADRGVIIAIDDLIKKHGAQTSVADIHPLYRALATYKGKTWGFYTDGDVWALYYRKDIFANPRLRQAYKAQFKRDLRVPRTWDEFTETAQFITDQMAPEVYGTGMSRALGNPGNYFYFYQTFRSYGGQFYEPKTMKALINSPAGVRAMETILKEIKASPPGNEKFDFLTMWTTWLQGKTAMIYTWGPTGRISENYAQRHKAFDFLPKSQIVGKVGYALVPGSNGEVGANGVVRTTSADSKNQEAAYLFTQWNTSPSISAQRVQLPFTLIDPFRISHYRSKQYASRWPAAKQYLSTLCNAANHALLDPIMVGAADYANAMDRAMTAMYAGKDVKSTLDATAREWDAITNKLGVDRVRESYQNFLKLPGSTSRNTVAKKGQAVKC